MRKSPAVRWLALGLAFWLSLVQSDAGVFHACESAIPSEATVTVPDARSDAHRDAHRDAQVDTHAHHAAHQETREQPSPDAQHASHGDGECHCLGHCCPFSAPDIPDADVFALTNTRRLSTTQPGRADHAVMASWVDFVLPFSTAPPVVIDA